MLNNIENPTLIDYFEGRCTLEYLQSNAKVFKLQDGSIVTAGDLMDELMLNNIFETSHASKSN